jgi:hypothetical protein
VGKMRREHPDEDGHREDAAYGDGVGQIHGVNSARLGLSSLLHRTRLIDSFDEDVEASQAIPKVRVEWPGRAGFPFRSVF